MLETAASMGWKVKDVIVRFHGIGRLVAFSIDEIAIRRHDLFVGDVMVHFPRAGFVVSRV